MIALCVLAWLAAAGAAPQFGLHGPGRHYHHGRLAPYHDEDHDMSFENTFGDHLFDAHRFWTEMEAEMHRFDQMMTEFAKHFPMTTSQTGVQGDEYVVVVNINGFEEKDIKVKAREGVLMIQAVHKSDDGSEKSYLDLKTLPSYVNVNGTWTYDMGTLRIVFPLNSKPDDVTEIVVTERETESPKVDDRDREEMEPDHSERHEDRDADVGIEENQNKDNEILTNVIPRSRDSRAGVEATTYAVDLKNEVEFVPIKY